MLLRIDSIGEPAYSRPMKNLRELGLKLLDYHGGQGTALYAVGSSWFAGRPVPVELVESAAAELRRYNIRGAKTLAAKLDAAARAAKRAKKR